MKQQYSEIQLQQEAAGWRLLDCPKDFLCMTGFSQEEIRQLYQDQFMQMLSTADMPAADELFVFQDGLKPLCPWIFSLACKGDKRMIPVLLQLISREKYVGMESVKQITVRIHDVSFLDTQHDKMEKQIRSLEQSIPSGLCQVLMDEEFTIIWHNQYFLDMLGYTEEQFCDELNCKAFGYIDPMDGERITNLLKNAIAQSQRVVTTEMRVIQRNKEERILLASLSFTDETINGIPVLYSAGIDITAQKRTQQLELDTARLRMAMEQTSSYLLEYDILHHQLLASDGLTKYFGITGNVDRMPDALLEKHIIAKESEETMRNLFRHIEAGSERSEGIVGICQQPGGNITSWFRLRMTSVYNETGTPVKAILLAEDITEQYLIEMRYREEEKRRVAMTYDMDFSCQFNLTTEKILSANRSKFAFFDFNQSDSCQELVRRNASQCIHMDDRTEYLRKLSIHYMVDHFTRGMPEITFDFRASDPHGNYHWSRGIIHIIKEPVHGDICAYLYTKNIENEKKLEFELRRHAEEDTLTGLLNRYTVETCCDRQLRNLPKGNIAVMYMLDLDHFKHLNDTFGHFRGDELLRQVAVSLRDIFGEEALIGRLGGDELVAFQSNNVTMEEATQKAQQICDTIRNLEAGAGTVTASVGLAFAPANGLSFVDLYHYSDDALYNAKQGGKNQWKIYTKQNGVVAQKERLPVSREWLLEESNDIIYVCDFYSYNLLYMNLEAKKAYHINHDNYRGCKCYEVLQNKTHPCEFCTNHLISHEDFYIWEFRNNIMDKSFLLRDRIIDWYGIPARIEFATDISIMDRKNQLLQEQVEIDHVIIACLKILNSARNLSKVAGDMLEKLAEFYGADRAYIIKYDAKSNQIMPDYEWTKDGIRSVQQIIGSGISLPEQVLEKISQHENYLFDCSKSLHQDSPQYYRMLYDVGVTCQRNVPIYMNGQCTGIIGVDNPLRFRDEMTVMETLSYFISEELSRNELSKSLSFLSYHDLLTGLWNRNQYVRCLEELHSKNLHSLGVAVADLNALKDINKMQGHTHGDLVVKRAGMLLTESVPQSMIFRLSGDEFVIHSENQNRLAFLSQVKQVSEGSDSLQAHGISIGYAWTDRDINSSQLTMQATEIMLMQKKTYYEHAKNEYSAGKHNYKHLKALMDNIQEGNFKMYLQPKADCFGYILNGAEALVRYETKETGLIGPDQFIPLLEKEHIIQYVDLFIFEEVCRLLSGWNKRNMKPITISLNFSRQTALEPDLLETLLRLTDQYQVPKDCIEVEITESLGDYDSSTIAEIGAGIKDAGFRLALDDFGSHYTNMAMLSTVPADVLKLDRGLIQNVMSNHNNQLVLKSILALCKELGISSIAEGVETQEQLELLRSFQCDSIQGYLFGRPIPVIEFERRYL